jgi:hypothetical protein
MRGEDRKVNLEHFLALAHLEIVEDEPTIRQTVTEEANGLALGFVRRLSDGYHLRHY